MLDYARTFGLPAVVFRMSCIYGPHQFGTEDQGWVAHFLIRALDGQPITIYGDGMQVRDVLFVDDLVDAFLLRAASTCDTIAGRRRSTSAAARRTRSACSSSRSDRRLHGERPDVEFDGWRAADQRYYVSDTRAFEHATGWRAAKSVPAKGLCAAARMAA